MPNLVKWYLSFVEDDVFLSACIVRVPAGPSRNNQMVAACREAHRQGCNPGGQVMGAPVPPGDETDSWPVNQPLTKEWLLAHGAMSLGDAGITEEQAAAHVREAVEGDA